MQSDDDDLEYFTACAIAAGTVSALIALGMWLFYEVWR